MKFLNEYRDPALARKLIEEIKELVSRPWNIMEICGGQTHSLVKNGILNVLPEEIRMLHGPGCPVCVTPLHLIDKAIFLAMERGVVLCSFGDMLRVPGSEMSLLEAKAKGADIRILYSPLEAVRLAQQHPEKEIVFFAVGFETTAPANALSVIQAKSLQLSNYSILTSHVLVPPAIEALMDDPEAKIDAFLAAGHVCSIMGYWQYHELAAKYHIPIVVSGFEPLDLLMAILAAVRQLENKQAKVENQYRRIVSEPGNKEAQKIINEVFEEADQMWRGIGTIPQSGWKIKEAYRQFDADRKFQVDMVAVAENAECIAGDIMKGVKKPFQCPQFGKQCHPQNPLGAPMVSSEGACAAYYNYRRN